MNDVEAGKAHITTYVENSQFFKGLRAAESGFKGFGDKLMSLGARMTGIGDAIGMTIGTGAAKKLVKILAGLTLGASALAPMGVAISKSLHSGAANGLLLAFLKLRDEAVAVVDAVATGLQPAIDATFRTITGIVNGVARWMANNRPLLQSLAGIVSKVVTIGGTLYAIGQIVSKIGSGFGALRIILAPLAAFLATPLGITVAIAAAIGVAVAAWMRFTESGQAAAQFFIDIFKPTIDIISEALGGIGDALMAGNLQLAGQIAVTALQLLFQQGIDSIAELLGGTLGAAIGDIGTRIIAGDLKGAWDSAITSMAALWAAFSSGVVEVFSSAANAVITAWQSVSNKISDTLLDTSAGGGVLGKIASTILGVDVGEEKRKSEEFDRKRGLKPQDALGDAKNAAREQIAGQAAFGKGLVESLRKQAEENAVKAIGDQQDRLKLAPKGSDRERELQNRLDGLTKQAAKERAGLKDIELPDKKDFGQVAVGFSGAALALQLNGGAQNPQREMLGELKKNKDLLGEAVGLLKKIKDKAAAFGITE